MKSKLQVRSTNSKPALNYQGAMMVFCDMKPNLSIHEIAEGSPLNTLKVKHSLHSSKTKTKTIKMSAAITS
jgi:hypothetical protein